MRLIVGLGNPGSRYEKTRHNIGFMVLDALADKEGFTINKKQNRCLLGQGFVSGIKILAAKPQSYMNKSGEAVLEVLNFFRDSIDDLIIVHDDLDLDFGRLRFRDGGGTAGHKGLKSISDMLNSNDYARLKIGIGRPPEFMKVENYVLSEFLPEERRVLPELIGTCVTGLESWCLNGIEKAMNDFNATCLINPLP